MSECLLDLAFPSKVHGEDGALLIDYFAGKIVQGMNANPDLLQIVTAGDIADGSHSERTAKIAYKWAKAMMVERQKVIDEIRKEIRNAKQMQNGV